VITLRQSDFLKKFCVEPDGEMVKRISMRLIRGIDILVRLIIFDV